MLLEELPDAPCPSLTKPDYIARAANRLRQRLRPIDPTDLDFELDDNHIPDGFFLSDVKKHGRRHLMFATDQQQQYLARAKTWYVDGTFKLCRHPFNQLLTVNAFVKQDDHAKQMPLLFVVMSGRKKKDYKKVFKKLLQVLPTDPAVSRITIDFEKAVWTVPVPVPEFHRLQRQAESPTTSGRSVNKICLVLHMERSNFCCGAI